MSSIFLDPQPPLRGKPLQKSRESWFGFLLAEDGPRTFAGSQAAVANIGVPPLGGADPTEPGSDRSPIDAALIVALILVSHVAIVDRFKHQPTEAVHKKQLVEINLIKPAPPPPPPVIEPKPEPPKAVIPPKPKPVVVPKPKVQPRPKPVPSPAARPALPDVPYADDAPPLPAEPIAEVPAPPPPPKPVEKTVQVSDADYLRPPEPEYPEDAQDRGWEGKVVVKARILPDGTTDSVQVQASSGHSSLDTAAVKAVKASLFKPNMQGETAMTVWALIPITFQL